LMRSVDFVNKKSFCCAVQHWKRKNFFVTRCPSCKVRHRNRNDINLVLNLMLIL